MSTNNTNEWTQKIKNKKLTEQIYMNEMGGGVSNRQVSMLGESPKG